MRLRQLQIFLAVVACGSIRAAARHEKLSQPTVTKTIRQLERDLGVPLFERSINGTSLTRFGHAFSRRARSIVLELDRASTEISQLRGGYTGTVTVGLTPTSSLLLVGPVTQRFRKSYPNIQLRFIDGMYEFLNVGLREGLLDFAIGPTMPIQPADDLEAIPLFESEVVPMVHKGNKLAKVRSLSDLCDHLWVSPGATSHMLLAATFEVYKLKPPQIVECESLSCWLEFVVNHEFIALLPRKILNSNIFVQMLEEIPVKETFQSAQYCLFRRTRMPLPPAAEVLAKEFITESIRKHRTSRPPVKTRNSIDQPGGRKPKAITSGYR